MLQPMWKSCCTALAALLLTMTALAQTRGPLMLDPTQDDIALAGHLEWLEDESASMTLQDVQASPGWAALPGMPNEGFTRSATWLRLTLFQYPGFASDWRLVIDDSQVDEARLHLPLAQGGWQVQRAGRLVEQADWPLAARHPVFRLQLQPGTQTVYLRLQSQHPTSHALHIYSADGYLKQTDREALAYGVFFGIFAVVIVLQLLFVALSRDRLSVWYLVYSVVLLTTALLRSGYVQLLLVEPDKLVNHKWLVGFTIVAPLIIVRLTAVWLNLNEKQPRLNFIYQSFAYLMGLLTLGMALLYQPALGMQINQLTTLALLAISLGIGIWAWRQGWANAGSYLLVFGVLDLGVAIRFARNLGGLPVNFYTDYAIFIGTALHLLMMSLYFVYGNRRLQHNLKGEQRAREEQRDFVNLVSHEFRTPLAIISTSIQQLTANLDAPAEKSLTRAQNIRNAVQRMDLLLDDYLSLDRLDSAQQALRPRICVFYDVIEDAASDWPLGRVRIIVDQLPPRFVCDPDLMRIVLRNLLANAVRHSPASSVIELDVAGQGDGSLRIRVQDQGEGIPAEELPHLFQRYFRGRASQGQPGAGLGLHLVQRIVRLHGGSIEVQSSVGQGTTFRITLPPGQLPSL